MSTSEVPWQVAFWFLPPLAINAMMQPTENVCGFHPSIRTYLRSSPILCIFDATAIIMRFGTYSQHGLYPHYAARAVIEARHAKFPPTIKQAAQPPSLEQALFPKFVWFILGVLPPAIKLLACSGLPWTRFWGCCYLTSFAIVELISFLASFTTEEQHGSGDFQTPSWKKIPSWKQTWLEGIEIGLGIVAVLAQLAFLSYVDLMAVPLDMNLVRTWIYLLFRLGAHLMFCSINASILGLQEGVRKWDLWLRRAGFIFSMFLVLASLTGLITRNMTYTLRYYVLSVIIYAIAWLMSCSGATRRHVLLCGSEDGYQMNVIAFDFFCWNLVFALYWYFYSYDAAGTSIPRWVNVFG